MSGFCLRSFDSLFICKTKVTIYLYEKRIIISGLLQGFINPWLLLVLMEFELIDKSYRTSTWFSEEENDWGIWVGENNENQIINNEFYTWKKMEVSQGKNKARNDQHRWSSCCWIQWMNGCYITHLQRKKKEEEWSELNRVLTKRMAIAKSNTTIHSSTQLEKWGFVLELRQRLNNMENRWLLTQIHGELGAVKDRKRNCSLKIMRNLPQFIIVHPIILDISICCGLALLCMTSKTPCQNQIHSSVLCSANPLDRLLWVGTSC